VSEKLRDSDAEKFKRRERPTTIVSPERRGKNQQKERGPSQLPRRGGGTIALAPV